MRDSTAVAVAPAASNRFLASFVHSQTDRYYNSAISFSFLDTPSTTSEVTYKMQWSGQAGDAHYINRNGPDDDNVDMPNARTASSMILMEFAS